MGEMQILELRDVRVSCANALNGQIASGFPAISSFLGFAKALERKLISRAKQHYLEEGYGTFDDRVFLEGVGIICSENTPQVAGKKLYPVQRGRTETAYNAKNYCATSIVRESYTNMTVTLLIGVHNLSGEEGDVRFIADEPVKDGFISAVKQVAPFLRMAGGTIEQIGDVRLHDPTAAFSVPYGYALVSAQDELKSLIEQQSAPQEGVRVPLSEYSEDTIFDALISPYLETVRCKDETIKTRQGEWAKKTKDQETLALLTKASEANKPLRVAYDQDLKERKALAGLGLSQKKRHFVAMQTGFVVLSVNEAGTVANARDMHTPFLFAEPLHGLMEWVPVSAFKNAKEVSDLFLWTYDYPHALSSAPLPRVGDMITFKNSYKKA